MIGINYTHRWSSDELNDVLDNWAPITKQQHRGVCAKGLPWLDRSVPSFCVSPSSCVSNKTPIVVIKY